MDARWSLNLITAPSAEVFTVATAKEHLRIEASVTEDDALITALIVSARTAVEEWLQRALVTQTWEVSFDSFPSYI